ncbi:MAG: methyltransferase domain-containing protein [Candidatus Rokubacteria bacterium]|nr:methyltransferase domain-containing protein [Candidatus Rokubacteria bacterium]
MTVLRVLARKWIYVRKAALVKEALKRSLLLACSLIPPLGRLVYNLEISPDGVSVGTGDMARDWDARARRNARWYIYWDAWKTEEEFDAAGEADVRDVVLKELVVEPGARALEIGCGIGRLVKPMSRRTAEVHGVDISAEMVQQGKERLEGLTNVQLRVCDGALSAYPAGHFDLCYSIAVFRHLPEKRFVLTYLAEAARVLKAAGIVRFEVWATGRADRREQGGTLVGVTFSEVEMRQLLTRLGFEVLEVEPRPGLPYVIYTARKEQRAGDETRVLVHWTRTRAESLQRSTT